LHSQKRSGVFWSSNQAATCYLSRGTVKCKMYGLMTSNSKTYIKLKWVDNFRFKNLVAISERGGGGLVDSPLYCTYRYSLNIYHIISPVLYQLLCSKSN